jgi:tryptophan-rich sensory protein
MVLVMKSWLVLAGFIVLCFAAASIGGLATGRSVDTWYRDLAKPSWTPPGWVFGPVWTLLYLAMAVAAWRVWENQGLKWPLALFGTQLAFNAAWSWLFFGLRMPGAACINVILLWVGILATTIVFWRVDVAAGIIFVPYLLWVTFASILNVAIWRMNGS